MIERAAPPTSWCWTRGPYTPPEEEIWSTRVRMTCLDGEAVHETS